MKHPKYISTIILLVSPKRMSSQIPAIREALIGSAGSIGDKTSVHGGIKPLSGTGTGTGTIKLTIKD